MLVNNIRNRLVDATLSNLVTCLYQISCMIELIWLVHSNLSMVLEGEQPLDGFNLEVDIPLLDVLD